MILRWLVFVYYVQLLYILILDHFLLLEPSRLIGGVKVVLDWSLSTEHACAWADLTYHLWRLLTSIIFFVPVVFLINLTQLSNKLAIRAFRIRIFVIMIESDWFPSLLLCEMRVTGEISAFRIGVRLVLMWQII